MRAFTRRVFTSRAATMADAVRVAVASLTPATGLAFVVNFFVDFLEVLLPTRDFFVTAIVDSPRI
jgi:hypothetical protein